ncbi:DUF6183 family protein [Actinoplanes sp. CA-142083]|uniref:DUF6183 family protein n=1 Tax=Actinoplanes sp. CA-142083 TaxID=3239903 RepID=UPI003D89C0C1
MRAPEEIASAIAELSDVTEVLDVVNRRLDAGDAGFVADLGIALWLRYGADRGAPWQYRSLLDSIIRLLCLTPGTLPEALEALAVCAGRRAVRYPAAMLASAHSFAELRPVFDADNSDELRACLVQELVLRGVEVDHEWLDSPAWREHPLGRLPLSLTAVEGRPAVTRYSLNAPAVLDAPGLKTRAVDGHGPVPATRETTTATMATAMGAAVADWTEQSNGRVEARAFALDSVPGPDAVGDTLLALGLESLPSLDSGWGACAAAAAWATLFDAASTGGAYSWGAHGAYGRLLTWQSIAALTGAAPSGPLEEIDALARGCSWYSFAGASPWFYHVAWDIGFAVVSPGRKQLAVLAATDTD